MYEQENNKKNIAIFNLVGESCHFYTVLWIKVGGMVYFLVVFRLKVGGI